MDVTIWSVTRSPICVGISGFSSSTESFRHGALILYFIPQIFDVLRIHAERLPYSESNQVDALCSRMANVSTREQVDECADAMLNQMSSLSLEHKGRMQSLKTN